MLKKMSYSEAGKLGAIALIKRNAELRKIKEEEYYLAPKYCEQCNCILDYTKRKNKFCNRKCSAKKNNILFPKRGPGIHQQAKYCLFCKEQLNHWKKIFCNIDCMQTYRREELLKKFVNGEVKDRGIIRKILLIEQSGKCRECGLSEWRGIPLSLEVDHIDGNASNNLPENLRVICPNCHSITDTWKGRNKGKGRASLGISLN